ncbi:MAG TPA: hypothetical protein VF042_04150 [Gemmatimonadaceae bacterium]
MRTLPAFRLLAVGAALVITDACTAADRVTSPALSVSSGRVTSTTTEVVVTSTSPSTSTRDVTLNVHIFGAGFDRGSTAQWALNGVPAGKVKTNSTTFVSSKELVANITVAADADFAYYDVIVTAASSGKPGIGTETFEIVVQTTNLGTLGGSESEATAINDQGQIVGSSYIRTGQLRPFIWQDGVMSSLGVLPGDGGYSVARDISNTGMVAGYGYASGAFKPWMWTSSGGIKLLPLPAGVVTGYVEAVNDDGAIVGSFGEIDVSHAAIWKNGTITDIHPRTGGSSHAWTINSLGDVAGAWYSGNETNSPAVPFVRRASGDVTWLPCPGVSCSTGSINSSGDIAGSVTMSDNTTYAFKWTLYGAGPSVIVGDKQTSAFGLSDNGYMAGQFHFSIWNNDGAALWGTDGTMVELQSESHKTAARGFGRDVNSSGWVVGYFYTSVKGTPVKRAVRWRYPLA